MTISEEMDALIRKISSMNSSALVNRELLISAVDHIKDTTNKILAIELDRAVKEALRVKALKAYLETEAM